MAGAGKCKPCLRVFIGRPWGRTLSMLEEPQAGEESDEKAVEVTFHLGSGAQRKIWL